MTRHFPKFHVSDVDVLAADVSLGTETPHPPNWEIYYSDLEPEGFRYASAWFHAAGEGIQLSVFIGAFLYESNTRESASADLAAELIKDAWALEELYSKARSAGRQLVALTEIEFDIPSAMPAPSVKPFPQELSDQ